MHYTYLLKCADGSFYCGYTTNPKKRVQVHNTGKGAKCTRSRLPVELVYAEEYETKSKAMHREWEIKQLSHAQKQELVSNMKLNK